MYTHLPHIVIPYQWSYAVMATGAALACTLLATFYACYKELAAQPAELMRPPSPKEGKRILLERVTLIWKHLNFTWKSAIRNLFRYKKRFFMTIAGIGGCMALMVVGFGIRDSIMCIGTIQYQEIQVYDGMIYLSSSVTEDQIQQIQDAMDGMDKMDRYIEMEMTREPVSVSIDGSTEDVYLCVPEDKDAIEDFMNFRSRTTGEVYHIQDEGVILTEKMANTLDVSSGDTIYLGADGSEKEVTVTAVCENYMEHYVYMSPELYQELYGKAPEYNSILFDLKDASTRELSQTGEELLKYDGVLNVTYTNSIEDQLNTMLQSLNLVIVVLIVSAGLLAFVVLYNLNNINITERRRELATLKVLGFYDTEVSSYVYRENIMLTIFSIAVGIVLGALLHRFVITTVEVDAVMFGRVVNWQSYLYSALFTTQMFRLFPEPADQQLFIKQPRPDRINNLVKKQHVIIFFLRFLHNFPEFFFVKMFSVFLFLIRHLKRELFLLQSRHKCDSRNLLHGLSFAGAVILHKLIDQDPVAISGCSDTESHTAGSLSFSVSTVNMYTACLSFHALFPSIAEKAVFDPPTETFHGIL